MVSWSPVSNRFLLPVRCIGAGSLYSILSGGVIMWCEFFVYYVFAAIFFAALVIVASVVSAINDLEKEG
jgi:hypothetical protein